MKRLTIIVLLMATVAGCATLDKKDDTNWFFPVAWDGDGRFSVLPVFWWTKNWFVLGPFATAQERDEGTLFPLVYWDYEIGKDHLWYGAGLGGYWRDYGKPTAHWLLPLYAKTGDGVFTIPFSRLDRKTRHTDFYLCGLGGYEGSEAGYRSSWVLPFYYHDQDGLYTPLYGSTDESSWMAPFYYRNKTGFHTLLWSSTDTAWWTLFGLAGGKTNVARTWHSNWVFPFYSARNERRADIEKTETSFLCGLYSVERTRNRLTLWTTSEHRILFIPVWR